MRTRALWLFILIGLLAASCAGSDDDASQNDDDDDRRPQAQILPPADPDAQFGNDEPEEPAENDDDGRLVVQSTQNQISTMLPDGSDVTVLTDDDTTINLQPTWALDGSRLAWVTVDAASGDAELSLDRYDGSDRMTVPVDTAPFYLSWNPSASLIAHLGPAEGGIDLGVADPFDEVAPRSRRVDRGQPFFFAWGPDGDELLVHASGFRLDRIDLEGLTVIVEEFPAAFGAPTWLPDDSIFHSDRTDGRQVLVSSGPSGEGRRPLASYDGTLRFAVSNQGNRIAMQAVPSAEDDEVVTASAPSQVLPGSTFEIALAAAQAEPTPTPTPEFDSSLDPIDELESLVPYTMGTFGGEAFALSDRPALALFPSPDGQAVAWLEQSLFDDEALVWRFGLGAEGQASPPFIPSTEMAQNYLPFFDQYSVSHDFWSPSGRFFVYAGRPASGDDEDGIWLFDTEAGSATRLADGVFAAFTRTPSAGGAASAL